MQRRYTATPAVRGERKVVMKCQGKIGTGWQIDGGLWVWVTDEDRNTCSEWRTWQELWSERNLNLIGEGKGRQKWVREEEVIDEYAWKVRGKHQCREMCSKTGDRWEIGRCEMCVCVCVRDAEWHGWNYVGIPYSKWQGSECIDGR